MTSRTMIYLEQDQLETLRARAERDRVPVTELVRRAVREYLGTMGRAPAPHAVYDRLVGIGRSRRTDVAEGHDRHLAEALSSKRAPQ